MIRLATDHDVHALVRLGATFHAHSAYAKHCAYSRPQAERTIRWLLEHGVVYVAERGAGLVGMIGAAITPNLCSGVLTCSEVFWWVNPDARGIGLRLLREVEAWARARGAEVMNLVAPSRATERLYRRLGFVRIEAAYARPLVKGPRT